jgi:hypothetical protein
LKATEEAAREAAQKLAAAVPRSLAYRPSFVQAHPEVKQTLVNIGMSALTLVAIKLTFPIWGVMLATVPLSLYFSSKFKSTQPSALKGWPMLLQFLPVVAGLGVMGLGMAGSASNSIMMLTQGVSMASSAATIGLSYKNYRRSAVASEGDSSVEEMLPAVERSRPANRGFLRWAVSAMVLLFVAPSFAQGAQGWSWASLLPHSGNPLGYLVLAVLAIGSLWLAGRTDAGAAAASHAKRALVYLYNA